nr:hypothetical protein GCM10025699_77770 [Microbacterium flavescens]
MRRTYEPPRHHLGVDLRPDRAAGVERHSTRNLYPTDKRGSLLTVTEESHGEVRSTLSAMHQRMIATAESLSADEQATVALFLDAMAASLSADGSTRPPRPGGRPSRSTPVRSSA